MSEKSDPRCDGPVPTPPEPNRADDESLPQQHDGAQTNAREAHKIGRGQPPPNTRWKKGGPSPNPKGRPRKDQTMLPDLKKVLEEALNKKVRVSRGPKQALMTRVDIGFEQLLNQVAQGDRHAWRVLMDIAAKVGIDFQAQHKHALEEALAPNHQAILDAALARRSGAHNAAAPAVLAPPELLDDDAAETARPPRSEAATPSAPAPASIALAVRPAAAPPATTKSASTARSVANIEIEAAATQARSATPPPRPKAASAPIASVPPRTIETRPAAVTKAQPGRASTEVKTPTPPDPEPNPLAPKPFSRMLWTEKRAWYPEWWALHVKCCAEQGIDP
jgi:hypothetical protein